MTICNLDADEKVQIMISSRFTGPLVREIDALLLAKTNKVEVEFEVVEVR